MRRNRNLTVEIKTQLPAELVSFLEQVGRLAAESGDHIYLAGGVVRDLLLHRPNLDLDLVVETDAVPLARKLAAIHQAKLVIHPAFRTASIRWDRWKVDFTTARAEIYRKPGSLPTIFPGTLMSDMYRRDFTINAMAVDLDPKRYGKLVDYLGGSSDLMRKEVRIIHNESFVDDATRIWRAVRYEQRLGFRIEPGTRRLLKRDLPMLDTISGDRLRHELEAVLREERPEKVLVRAGRLGLLQKLHPALKCDRWLSMRFERARKHYGTDLAVELYFALLTCRLRLSEAQELIAFLKPSRTVSNTVEETINLKNRLGTLAEAEMPPSRIHALLAEYSVTAVKANCLASDSALVRRRLSACLEKYRNVKTSLTGNDLHKMGIAPGPAMKTILKELLNARLDGMAKSRKDELALVNTWLEKQNS